MVAIQSLKHSLQLLVGIILMIHSGDVAHGAIGNSQAIGAVADNNGQHICQLLRIDVSYFHIAQAVFVAYGVVGITVDGEVQTFFTLSSEVVANCSLAAHNQGRTVEVNAVQLIQNLYRQVIAGYSYLRNSNVLASQIILIP